MPAAVSIGEILWDILPSGKALGGAPANVAWHMAQLGADVRIVSAVGTDAPGDEILDRLRAMGLDTSLIARVPGKPTGTVDAEISPDGIPRYRIHDDVAWDRILPGPASLAAAGHAAAVNFGTLAQRTAAGMEATLALLDATGPGCLRAFDVNLRAGAFRREVLEAGLARASLVKMNDEELVRLAEAFSWPRDPEAALDALFARHPGVRHVIVTRGAEGAWWKFREHLLKRPGRAVAVADTIGAGDALTAAVITGLLRGLPPEAVLDAALDIAAFVCTQTGATPPLPDRLKGCLKENRE